MESPPPYTLLIEEDIRRKLATERRKKCIEFVRRFCFVYTRMCFGSLFVLSLTLLFMCSPSMNYVGSNCIGTSSVSCKGPVSLCYVDFGDRTWYKFNIFKLDIFDVLGYTDQTKKYNQTCKIESHGIGTPIYALVHNNYWCARCASVPINIICFTCH